MTTICYRDKVLCSDTAIFDRGTYCGKAKKITSALDGTIGGGAGELGLISSFLDWIASGAHGSPPEIGSNQDAEFLWIKPDGSVWWRGPDSVPTQLFGEFFAIGSGFRIALGAMAHGASAIEAVSICAQLDNLTRGPIEWLGFDDR